MMYWGPGFGWGGMFFGGLMMLLFWGALIVLAILGFRALTHSGGGQSRDATRTMAPSEDGAVVILRERYAKGEIDKQQFEQMRADLSA
jgi:putative membrane protein